MAISDGAAPPATRRGAVVVWSTTALVIWSVLAFGGVYEWAYRPAFVCAIVIGISGLWRSQLSRHIASLFVALIAVMVTIALQLVPIPRLALGAISPHLDPILRLLSIPYANGAPRHALSLRPDLTLISLVAFGSLTLLLAGLCSTLTPRRAATLVRNVVILGVAVAIFGVAQKATFNGRLYWFWVTEGTPWSSFGPFVNHNHCAGFLTMTIGLSLGYLRLQARSATRERGSSWLNAHWLTSEHVSRVVLVVFAVFIMAIGVLWTQSRSGFVALLVVCAVFLLATLRRSKARLVWLSVVGAIVLVALSWRGIDTVARSFGDPRTPASRLGAWRDGATVVRDFPFVGTGLNTFGTSMLVYQRTNLDSHLAQTHNDYIQLAAEGGMLVGLPACSALFMLWRIIRLRRRQDGKTGDWKAASLRDGAIAGLCGIAVQEIAEFSLQMPGNAIVFVVLLATALMPTSTKAQAT
jgi:O-antigen ligase